MPFNCRALVVHVSVSSLNCMTRPRLTSTLATSLLIVASVFTGAILMSWGACFGGFSADCAALTQLESHWLLPSLLWIVSLSAAIAALFIAPRKTPVVLAVGLLLVVNPLTDAGAFFIPWDTADTLPFTGLWVSAAAIATALLVGLAARAQPMPGSAPERAAPSMPAASR